MGSPTQPAGAADKTLAYCRALLELTVRENGDAMNTITRVFSDMASLFGDVERHCRRIQAGAGSDLNGQIDPVIEDCAAAASAIRDGLRAVQVHDITDQRLAHVVILLAALREGRDCEISAVLSDSEEHALLDLIERGVSGEDAFGHLGENSAARGSVELF